MIYQVGIAPQTFHDINLLALAGKVERWIPASLNIALPSLTPLSTLIRPVVTYTALTLHPHTLHTALLTEVEPKELHCPLNSGKSTEISQ